MWSEGARQVTSIHPRFCVKPIFDVVTGLEPPLFGQKIRKSGDQGVALRLAQWLTHRNIVVLISMTGW